MNLLPGFVKKWFDLRATTISQTVTTSQNRYISSVFSNLSRNSVIWVNDSPQKYIDEGYYLNPDVYAAINCIVRLCSIAPLNLYNIKDKKAYKQYNFLLKNLPNPNIDPVKFRKHFNECMDVRTKALVEVESHKVLDKLDRPNEYQSKGEFLENCYGFRLATGNFLVFKAKAKIGTPEIMNLYLLPPQNTNIISGGIDKPIEKYRLGYSDNDTSFDPSEIIHNRSWSLDYSSPGSHLWGIAPLRSALRSLTMGNDGREAQTWLLQNKGSDVLVGLDPEGLKTTPTKPQLEELKDDFRQTSQGMHNKGKANIAVGKFTVHQLGGNSSDIGIQDAITLSKEDICKVYGISPLLLGSLEQSTFDNMKAANRAAITNAAIPLLLSARDSWNKDLLPEFEKGGNYTFDYDLTVYPELAEDRGEQATYLDKAWWLTGEEKRLEMGYGESKEPLLQKFYLPANLTPIDQANSAEIVSDQPISEDYSKE